MYSEDGEIYDAVILSVDAVSETCYVRYVGYGNEEEQYLPNLLAFNTKLDAYKHQHSLRRNDSECTSETQTQDSETYTEVHNSVITYFMTDRILLLLCSRFKCPVLLFRYPPNRGYCFHFVCPSVCLSIRDALCGILCG